MQNLEQVQNERLAQPIGHNAHAAGENHPEVETLMIIAFASATPCILL